VVADRQNFNLAREDEAHLVKWRNEGERKISLINIKPDGR
jgi:hypothetical protein